MQTYNVWILAILLLTAASGCSEPTVMSPKNKDVNVKKAPKELQKPVTGAPAPDENSKVASDETEKQSDSESNAKNANIDSNENTKNEDKSDDSKTDTGKKEDNA